MKHGNQNASPVAPAPVELPASIPTPQTIAPVVPAGETFGDLIAKLTLTPKQLIALTTLLAQIAKRTDSPIVSNPRMNPADQRKLIFDLNGTRIQIGPGGGYEALDIRTYPRATVDFIAVCDGKMSTQNSRDAAKVASQTAGVERAAAVNAALKPVAAAAATIADKPASPDAAKISAALAETLASH